MTPSARPWLPLIAIAVLAAAGGVARAEADIIFLNGRIRTLAPGAAASRSLPTALAVSGERIVFVGDDEGAGALRGAGTQIVDLHGATVLPGLTDAHGHLQNLGKLLRNVSLVGTSSAAEVAERVRESLSKRAPGSWVYGRGWDQNDWTDTSLPSWRELSGTETHPVYLTRIDGHAVWLNRTALDRCGVTRATADPAGGRIVRDMDGEPTGVLIDDAVALVDAVVPPRDAAEVEARLEQAIGECNRFGLVGVHDAGVDRAALGALRSLASRGALTLDVYCLLDSDEPDLLREYFRKGPSSEFGGRIVLRAVKLRADGALGSRGAALLAPYDDDRDNRGINVDLPDSILYWTREAVRHGFQVGTHAIGDRGNRITLDAYETVLQETGARDARLRVEHCQLLAPEDIPRFAALGVIASMQPTHATSDMPWAEKRVGRARLKGAYAWRTLADGGAVLAFGSDFPVESANPLLGIYAAVTRQDGEGNPPGGWFPEQSLTPEEAVRAFTWGAAYAAFAEADEGLIAPGRLASLTILDHDPLAVTPRELLNTRVVMTVVRGAIVYQAPR